MYLMIFTYSETYEKELQKMNFIFIIVLFAHSLLKNTQKHLKDYQNLHKLLLYSNQFIKTDKECAFLKSSLNLLGLG